MQRCIEPLIGRLVTTKKSHIGLNQPKARKLLLANLQRWPNGQQVHLLMTPGGFLKIESSGSWGVKSGWQSRNEDFAFFRRKAMNTVTELMNRELRKKIKEVSRFLTLGVDLMHPDGAFEWFECETVVTWDSQREKAIMATGKSLPTSSQQNRLVGEPDLKSHCQNLGGKKVLVLGCQDLNFFSARAKANYTRGSKKQVRSKKMNILAKMFNPDAVLQHPHSTDTPAIWRTAWAGLTKTLGTDIAFASATSPL